jgi:ribosomal protein L40E
MEPLALGVGEILSFMVLLALWLGLAYIPARIAHQKGYSFWLTYGGGLIAWWLLLIIALVIQPKSTLLQSPSIAALDRLGGRRVCQVCGTTNPLDTTQCRKCGITFTFTNDARTAVETMFLTDDVREEVNEGRTRVCQRCGRLNSPKRSVCKSCGTEFAV